MTAFFQAAGAVLLGVVLIMSIRSQGKDIGLLLSIFLCVTLGCLAIGYLKPVIAFLQQLQSVGSLNSEMLGILLKITGIAFVAEIAALVCADAGNAAMGKTLQFLAVAVILYLSLPMLSKLLELVESILGNL